MPIRALSSRSIWMTRGGLSDCHAEGGNEMPRWLTILGVALLLLGVPWATLARPQSPLSVEKTRQCPKFPGANQFVPTIDNRFLPLEPGTTFIYREKADGETQRDVVAVTDRTK